MLKLYLKLNIPLKINYKGKLIILFVKLNFLSLMTCLLFLMYMGVYL